MVYISCIANSKVESQSIEFTHLPNDVGPQRRANNQITFPVALRQCDIVVELESKACRKFCQDRTELKVITGIAYDGPASKRGCVPRQRCPNRLLTAC